MEPGFIFLPAAVDDDDGGGGINIRTAEFCVFDIQ